MSSLHESLRVKTLPLSSLTPQFAAEELIRRRQTRVDDDAVLDFRSFVGRVNPRFQWFKHCELLADVAERVVSGESKREMVFLPPRHSKSETVSRLLTAYFLYRHPEQWVGLTSYAAELAYVLSRASRDNYAAATNSKNRFSEATAVKHWETGKGGGLWAAGVGGAITGKGFHLGCVDDPIKNYEEAKSETIKERNREWYRSTFYTRAEPDAAIVLIQTRWAEDDLAGWQLAEELEGDAPEHWHIVDLPAIAEPAQEYPPTCTVEPDWREEGEALCPERYPIEKLERIKSKVGGYHFGSLYQQRPSAREGSFFNITKFGYVDADELPEIRRTCRAWDLAASKGKGDFTAGAKVGLDNNGRWYVLDVGRGQWASDERNNKMLEIAAQDGRTCHIRLAQDPGQAGVDQAQALVRMFAGYGVSYDRISGSKETRADPFGAQVNAGNVTLLRGHWNAAFVEELRQFPTGKHDDQVDAVSDAFNQLAKQPEFKWV